MLRYFLTIKGWCSQIITPDSFYLSEVLPHTIVSWPHTVLALLGSEAAGTLALFR